MAVTTIADLPRDALVLIFCAAFDAAVPVSYDPEGHVGSKYEVHENLRRVCREWRDAADIAFFVHQEYSCRILLSAVRDPATVRARFPGLIRSLAVDCYQYSYFRFRGTCCTEGARTAALAISSLCASPEMRRVLTHVSLEFILCLDEAAAAVSAIVACPHLTSLELAFQRDGHAVGTRSDILAPLSQLTGLKELSTLTYKAFLPLPDSPSLTRLTLRSWDGPFAVMGSDACLGRLRSLTMSNKTGSLRWEPNDPLGLRAALDTGTWQPHLLTHVQTLCISIHWSPIFFSYYLFPYSTVPNPRVYRGATPAAAVWAPLASTVTELKLSTICSIYRDADLETGMYAGLGVLTGLQSLVIENQGHFRCPVDFASVHFPHLTRLVFIGYRGPPIDLARFPLLVSVEVKTLERAWPYPSPVALASVAALRRLESLGLSSFLYKPELNMAQLFGGGRRLAALTGLSFECVTLAWDAAAAPGAPTAAEFAARAGALLPSLRSLEIKRYVQMDEGVREFVVPAMQALGRG